MFPIDSITVIKHTHSLERRDFCNRADITSISAKVEVVGDDFAEFLRESEASKQQNMDTLLQLEWVDGCPDGQE